MKQLHRSTQLALGLLAILATSCNSLPFSQSLSNLLTGTTDQATSQTAGIGQNATCTTPNYVAKLEWQGDQPKMTFGRSSGPADLQNATAIVTNNPDGSITYQVAAESSTYARIYPDSTCFVQVVQAGNQVVLEENGRLGG